MSTITTTNRRSGTSAQPTAPKTAATAAAKPHLIRRRAYEIFLARNGGPGDHLSDWIQAEQELNSVSQIAPIAGRSGEHRGNNHRAEVTPQPVRDGILDNH